MRIYDSLISKVSLLLEKETSTNLKCTTSWPTSEEKVFLFTEDCSVELGPNNLPSTYLIAYTSDEKLVSKDEIILIGKDISELKGEVPFARITFINIDDSQIKADQESYRILRNIEYHRYKVNPQGYMIRVNTNQIREGARVSTVSQKKGLSFSDIGTKFLTEYKKDPKVRFVKQVFITSESFDYDSLRKISHINEGITVALDHIMKNLKMDCNTCSFKDICDSIEGMRDIHKREEYQM
ncbi:MAG: hypothetical protein WCR67_02020 [Bacilli bacterium]